MEVVLDCVQCLNMKACQNQLEHPCIWLVGMATPLATTCARIGGVPGNTHALAFVYKGSTSTSYYKTKYPSYSLIQKADTRPLKMKRGTVLILLVASLLIAGCYARRSSTTGTTRSPSRITIPSPSFFEELVSAAFEVLGTLAQILLGCYSDAGVIAFPISPLQNFLVVNCFLNGVVNASATP